MDKTEIIRLNAGEKIKVNKNIEGWTIEGPATVVVVKEEAAKKAAGIPDIGQGPYGLHYQSELHIKNPNLVIDEIVKEISKKINVYLEQKIHSKSDDIPV